MDVRHRLLRAYDLPEKNRDEQVSMPWLEIDGRLVAADGNLVRVETVRKWFVPISVQAKACEPM